MNLSLIKNIYLIGIGGIGMSALARYFHKKNKHVSGYDKNKSKITDSLILKGVKIVFNDDVNYIEKEYLDSEKTLVITTPAVPKTNSILNFFNNNNYKVLKRAEVLGLVTSDTKCLAIAGTHGKTTTTSILAHLMLKSNQKVTAFLGGISENYKSNFVEKGSEFSIVEADEFDRSFLHLNPSLACITSMDSDHLDVYKNETNLKIAFKQFSDLLPSKNNLFVHESINFPGLSYGFDSNSDYYAQNLSIKKGYYIFDLKTPKTTYKSLKFPAIGKHNLSNAIVAFAMALETGCDELNLRNSLESYIGVERRFTVKIKTDNFLFIDDYAHHPKEIDAVWNAISEIYPNKRITVIFQPHLFSRTKDFADEFANSLSKFDSVLLLDIYPARELPIEGVTSNWLLSKVNSNSKKLVNKNNLITHVKKINNPILITIGAGDIDLVANELTKKLLNNEV